MCLLSSTPPHTRLWLPQSPATFLLICQRRCQDRKNTCRRFSDCLQLCQTVSQTGWQHERDSHTFCDVPRPSGQLQETPRQSVTRSDSLSLSRRLFGNFL
ncbi:hypothetical protein DPMN_128556 [Dreissena polymorpha]|uniref:Uncharacterized protein n=1 Tax=Dreissena polymorpha TaxID=45954 RepID=A0A9D4H1E6_DREPO|nr:hypothetical protein DPMN_128556 [Dreissena polymorpha]